VSDKRRQVFWLALGSLGIWYVLNNQTDVETAAQAAQSDLEAAVLGWKNAGSGPTWVPILNQAEEQYGLPQDILAATAYQESSFIENVIRGLKPSSDGLSLGIMQLQTQFFPSLVGPSVPVPYTDQNVSDQINAAAQVFAENFAALGNWEQTIAAYNQGLAGVQRNGITSVSYVQNIVGNAPAALS
jgi:Transglycosylase SLT domain